MSETLCRYCGAKILYRPGHSGRYRYTDCFDGTDIFGSGSECPSNERGHEPGDTAETNAWVAWVERYEYDQLMRWHPELRDLS